jgi:uncharacterized metal-binding protein YceD (DUF177 family)
VVVVNTLKDFVIQFSGLEEGIHTFEFIVDNKFFKEFEMSEINEGNVNVDVQMDKQTTMMILDFAINGYITCVCDRCLENYPENITGNERIILKFSEDKSEESDEIKVLSPSENEIDISQDIYEFINLLLPIKRVHPDDKKGKSTCNPEIIKILEKLNVQKNIDPRWDELKKISLKN